MSQFGELPQHASAGFFVNGFGYRGTANGVPVRPALFHSVGVENISMRPSYRLPFLRPQNTATMNGLSLHPDQDEWLRYFASILVTCVDPSGLAPVLVKTITRPATPNLPQGVYQGYVRPTQLRKFQTDGQLLAWIRRGGKLFVDLISPGLLIQLNSPSFGNQFITQSIEDEMWDAVGNYLNDMITTQLSEMLEMQIPDVFATPVRGMITHSFDQDAGLTMPNVPRVVRGSVVRIPTIDPQGMDAYRVNSNFHSGFAISPAYEPLISHRGGFYLPQNTDKHQLVRLALTFNNSLTQENGLVSYIPGHLSGSGAIVARLKIGDGYLILMQGGPSVEFCRFVSDWMDTTLVGPPLDDDRRWLGALRLEDWRNETLASQLD